MAEEQLYIVRKATVEDMQAVRDMVQELADYEKMRDGPKISTKDLTNDAGLNGGQEFMHCYVAEKKSSGVPRTIVGYSICFFSYSTWEGKSYFIEDIYVRPEHRKQGVGHLIFRHVAKIAKDNNCPRLDFHVLSWNTARQFYEKYGATNLTATEGWQFYRLHREQIDRLLEE